MCHVALAQADSYQWENISVSSLECPHLLQAATCAVVVAAEPPGHAGKQRDHLVLCTWSRLSAVSEGQVCLVIVVYS